MPHLRPFVWELTLAEWYERFVLPRLTNLACGLDQIGEQRRKIVPEARGQVVEIGFGSGLNIPFYESSLVKALWGVEPSHQMLELGKSRAAGAPFPVTLLEAPGEAIPLPSGSVDTAVSTYTLCTIADPVQALREVGRLLRPGGQLLFAEHGRAPDPSVRGWQGRLTPIWKRIAGGCHLNRDIPELLRTSGFEIVWLDSAYISGPKLVGFQFVGAARLVSH